MQRPREHSFVREYVVRTIQFQQKVGVPTYSLSGQDDYEFEATLNYIIARVCSKMKIKEFIKKICVYSTIFFMWHLLHFYIRIRTLSEPKTGVQDQEMLTDWVPQQYSDRSREVLCPLSRWFWGCGANVLSPIPTVPWESEKASWTPVFDQVFDGRPFDLDRPYSWLFLPCYRYKIGSQVWQDIPVITTLRKLTQEDFEAKPA